MSIEGQTYASLISEVLEHQFSESKYKPLVSRWLNEAQRRLVIESELRTQEESESITTEANVATLTLPTNYGRFIDLYNTETKESLEPLTPHDIDNVPTSTGRPYAFAIIGGTVTLYPTPDGAYPLALRYWKLPEDMVNESDTPSIPVQYHELLIAYAMKKAFLRENDLQMAQTWEGQWEKGILKLRGEAVNDSFSGPRQVAGSFDYNEYPYIGWWR